MPTTTDHRETGDIAGRAPEPVRNSKLSAVAIVVASLATLLILFVMLSSSNDKAVQVYSVPSEPEATSQPAASAEPQPSLTLPPPVLPPTQASPRAQASPQGQAPPPAPVPPADQVTPRSPASPTVAQPEPEIDELGFVDSEARCNADQHAVAIARTEAAQVVICRDGDGDYVYQGVRLSDGASLQLDDVRPMPTGFEARNGATTYRLSPTELVVIDGETLHSRDPIVEYQAG